MLSTRNQLLEHGPPTLPRGPFWHLHLRKRQRRESCETVAWTLEVGMPFAMQTWLAGKLKCWNSTFVYQWKFSFQVPASIAGKCGGQVGNQSFPEDPEAYVGLTCFYLNFSILR